ncbi:peptide-methionine (R)-S-oxide reductase MsrB [Candidatus Kaiserbacteria bacterium]|nr:peptide-methionine (R)-S-oxide reductase MsrB [Candidatus Kaiserbacteria bacterium]
MDSQKHPPTGGQTEDTWKEKLSPEAYVVLREKGTEMPFSGKLLQEKRDGMYRCAACGNPLFPSDAKFDSGTGWPSFDKALPGAIKEISDTSHGMERVETVCANCGSHLGHIFDDGPTETGKRYCMNSVCLDFSQSEIDEVSKKDKNVQ